MHAGDCYVYATLALQATSRHHGRDGRHEPADAPSGAHGQCVSVPGAARARAGRLRDRRRRPTALRARAADGEAPDAARHHRRHAAAVARRDGRGRGRDDGASSGGTCRSPVPEPPVYISASGPRALELTGEVADGLILLAGLFPEGLAFAREHVARGRERPATVRSSTRRCSCTARSPTTRQLLSTRRARSPPGSRRRHRITRSSRG